MFGYREYDHNVCVDENFIQNSIKTKFNEIKSCPTRLEL